MLCDESTWNKSLELCCMKKSENNDFLDQIFTVILYLNYLFINRINGTANRWELSSLWYSLAIFEKSNRCSSKNFAKIIFSWISTFPFRLRLLHCIRYVEINDRFQCYDFLSTLALLYTFYVHITRLEIGKLLLHKCIKKCIKVSEKWKYLSSLVFQFSSSFSPRLRQLFHFIGRRGVLQCSMLSFR